MSTLYLAQPTMAYEDQLLAYKRETLAMEPDMNGVGGLGAYDRVEDWLQFLKLKSHSATCPAPFVPDSTFMCIRRRDDRLVGMVNIRHELNDWLLHYAGHIGYSIRPDERGKGYAKEQLRLALDVCRGMGLARVLLTCDESNLRSRRVIQACGGLYEDSRIKPGAEDEPLRRYWINLS